MRCTYSNPVPALLSLSPLDPRGGRRAIDKRRGADTLVARSRLLDAASSLSSRLQRRAANASSEGPGVL